MIQAEVLLSPSLPEDCPTIEEVQLSKPGAHTCNAGERRGREPRVRAATSLGPGTGEGVFIKSHHTLFVAIAPNKHKNVWNSSLGMTAAPLLNGNTTKHSLQTVLNANGKR